MREPNQVFLIPEPKQGDTRERNAFGILRDFGRDATRYYETQDARGACDERAVNQML